jgi:methyl-accepting chemotaxis protein
MHTKTKSELLTIIGNLTLQLDIERDKAIIRKERIEELEEELDEKIELEDILDIAKDIMDRLKASRFKLSLGVESEAEEVEKLTEKLEETLS